MNNDELKKLYDEYYSNKKELKQMLKDKEITYPHKRIEFVQLKDRNKYVHDVLVQYNLIHDE